MIQSHFANVASQDTPTATLYNLINLHAAQAPVSDAKLAETMFDEDLEIFLPANAETTITRICEFPQELQLIAMFTHAHSRNTGMEVYTCDAATGVTGELLYENRSWDHPPFYTTERWGGPIASVGLKMVSHYRNDEDRDIMWGPFVQENEHFETYATWYPSIGLDPFCACHREGEPPTGSCPAP
jgi:hypothetical protein